MSQVQSHAVCKTSDIMNAEVVEIAYCQMTSHTKCPVFLDHNYIGRPRYFLITHDFRRLCSRLPNEQQTIFENQVTSLPRPHFIPDHSRLFWTVQNSREPLDRVHRPLRTLPDQIRTFPDLPPSLHDLSRLARSGEVGLKSAKCDRGLRPKDSNVAVGVRNRATQKARDGYDRQTDRQTDKQTDKQTNFTRIIA